MLGFATSRLLHNGSPPVKVNNLPDMVQEMQRGASPNVFQNQKMGPSPRSSPQRSRYKLPGCYNTHIEGNTGTINPCSRDSVSDTDSGIITDGASDGSHSDRVNAQTSTSNDAAQQLPTVLSTGPGYRIVPHDRQYSAQAHKNQQRGRIPVKPNILSPAPPSSALYSQTSTSSLPAHPSRATHPRSRSQPRLRHGSPRRSPSGRQLRVRFADEIDLRQIEHSVTFHDGFASQQRSSGFADDNDQIVLHRTADERPRMQPYDLRSNGNSNNYVNNNYNTNSNSHNYNNGPLSNISKQIEQLKLAPPKVPQKPTVPARSSSTLPNKSQKCPPDYNVACERILHLKSNYVNRSFDNSVMSNPRPRQDSNTRLFQGEPAYLNIGRPSTTTAQSQYPRSANNVHADNSNSPEINNPAYYYSTEDYYDVEYLRAKTPQVLSMSGAKSMENLSGSSGNGTPTLTTPQTPPTITPTSPMIVNHQNNHFNHFCSSNKQMDYLMPNSKSTPNFENDSADGTIVQKCGQNFNGNSKHANQGNPCVLAGKSFDNIVSLESTSHQMTKTGTLPACLPVQSRVQPWGAVLSRKLSGPASTSRMSSTERLRNNPPIDGSGIVYETEHSRCPDLPVPPDRQILVRPKALDSNGVQLVELEKVEPGPFGFYIATGTFRKKKGIFISRISVRSLAMVLTIGDQLLEIDGVPTRGRTLEQVQAMMADKDRIVLKLLPVVMR